MLYLLATITKEDHVSDRGYRSLVDSLTSGQLQPAGFLAALESRVDVSLPPAVNTGARPDNVVLFDSRFSRAARGD